MNFLYVSDDKYSYIAGISMMSLIDSHDDNTDINIFLVNDGIECDNLKKIYSICSKDNVYLHLIDFSTYKSVFDFETNSAKWGKNVFARLICGHLFSDYNIDRVIYLDCDTLVLKSLVELWEMDINENIIAAVNESMGYLHKRLIGLSNDIPYCNSGVILIDVNKWKKNNIDEKIIDFLGSRRILEYPDEAAMNNVLQGKIQYLPAKYNATSLTFYFTAGELKKYRKSSTNNSIRDHLMAFENPIVVHFTSTFLDVRPWMVGCRHKYFKQWEGVKNKSPWKDVPLYPARFSIKKNLICKLIKGMPLGLGFSIAGILHAYVKPLKYLFR